MKKIILKSGFTLYQKIFLILLFLVTFFIGFVMFLGVILMLFKVLEFEESFMTKDYILLSLFPISLFILLQLLSKNGILINKGNLYSAKYIFKKIWFQRKANIDGITDITILSFKGNQKFSFVSVANPDKSYTVYNNSIYLLNEKHTIKRHLITTNDKNLTERALVQINELFNFNYKQYNPRFNTRGKRR